MIGLFLAMRQMRLDVVAACSSAIPSHFGFIPAVEHVVHHVETRCDLVITLDCSAPDRLGEFANLLNVEDRPLINIDHHITNEGFGDVDLVDPEASSTAEVVLRLLEHMGVSLDAEIATALLVGIVTDTRGFRTNNVTSQVMGAATRLMEAGASLPDISRRVLDRRPTAAIRLWAAALRHVHIADGVIWTSIMLAERREAGYRGNSNAGLTNFLLSADGADVSVVFAERDDGDVDVSMRAEPGFDVTEVALAFGGGGHALAAGCRLLGPLEEAERHLLSALRVSLDRQRRNYA